MLETIRSWINRFPLRQELIVAVGVILFFVGLLSPASAIRITAFVLCGCALAYALVAARRRRPEESRARQEQRSSTTSEERESEMKKLALDDSQPGGKKYTVDVVEETAARGSPRAAKPARAATVDDYEFHLTDFFDVNEDLYVREEIGRAHV